MTNRRFYSCSFFFSDGEALRRAKRISGKRSGWITEAKPLRQRFEKTTTVESDRFHFRRAEEA